MRTEIKIQTDLLIVSPSSDDQISCQLVLTLKWKVKYHQKKRQNNKEGQHKRLCKVLHLHFYATLPTERCFYSWHLRVGNTCKISYNVLKSANILLPATKDDFNTAVQFIFSPSSLQRAGHSCRRRAVRRFSEDTYQDRGKTLSTWIINSVNKKNIASNFQLVTGIWIVRTPLPTLLSLHSLTKNKRKK